jgi:hypothetical protein
MTKGQIHKAVVLAVLGAVAAFHSGAAASSKRSSAEIISALRRSDLPLVNGAGECRDLAAHYATLGALVTAHDKRANRERIATCGPNVERSGTLSCKAQFSNGVPPERSEEEWTLVLEFDMKGRTIGNLKCFLAG